MRINFFIGFVLIFVVGLTIIAGITKALEAQYNLNLTQILGLKAVLCLILVAIPPVLLFIGRGDDPENRIEKIGKPITSFFSILGSATVPLSVVILLVCLAVFWR